MLGELRAHEAGAKTRKGGAEAPPPCCDVVLTPVRDDRSAPRDLSVSGSRAHLHGCPQSGRRNPGLGPLFSVAWLRRGANLGQVGTGVQRLSLQLSEPYRPHPTALRRTRQAVAHSASLPLRLQPPLAGATLGLPCPYELRDHLGRLRVLPPAPSARASSALGSPLRHPRIAPPARFRLALGPFRIGSSGAFRKSPPAPSTNPQLTGPILHQRVPGTRARVRLSPISTEAGAPTPRLKPPRQRKPATSATSSRKRGRGTSI